MAGKYVIDERTLNSIATAIREKEESTEPIAVTEFSERISNIKTNEDLETELNTYEEEVTEQEVTLENIAELLKVKGGVAPPKLQDKTVNIVANGIGTVAADDEYAGLNTVTFNVNVPAAKYTPRWIRFSSYEGTNLTDEVSNLDTSKMTSFYAMFQSCNRVTALDLKHFDVTNITNMGSMFQQCNYLTSLDISGWGTNKATNFGSMFSGCSALKTLDLRTLYSSSCTAVSSMFNTCSQLQSVDMTGCDLSNVTTVYQMFNECGALTDVSKINWNMPKITGTG